MKILDSVSQLLEHIKVVQVDTIELSKKSLLNITELIEKNGIEIDEKTAEALQYQDIISQQLSATIEAIDGIQKNIDIFRHTFLEDENIATQSMEKLDSKLSDLLEVAREKREAFSGKLLKDDNSEDDIEFF